MLHTERRKQEIKQNEMLKAAVTLSPVVGNRTFNINNIRHTSNYSNNAMLTKVLIYLFNCVFKLCLIHK